MSRGSLIALALALTLAACSPGTGVPAPTPTGVSTPGAASGACIDRGQLADDGETVTVALQGVAAALKAGNADQARSLAGAAATGLRKMVDLVQPVRPDAAKGFSSAADALERATSAFPDGLPIVEQVQADLEAAYQLARTVACPE
ncbi:MAG TPA: hypothetical protein VFJ80_01995 [Candidatus Limnocylindrales bacterium]|jgi:hypothetical protein|nr:hypothetical protein [Candidatus Limnocylindrales bacterium]